MNLGSYNLWQRWFLDMNASMYLETAQDYEFGDDSRQHHDRLAALFITEASYPVGSFVCRNSEKNPMEDWRRKICQWSFRVIDHFQLDREVVSIGMNIFDRFLYHFGNKVENRCSYAPTCNCSLCTGEMNSKTYQLAAMTSVYMAMKMNSSNEDLVQTEDGQLRRKVFKLNSFVELSRGQFTSKDVTDMELIILQTINWKVNAPTPMTFVNYLMDLLPVQDITSRQAGCNYQLVKHILRELARYLTELAVCLGSDVSTARPSQVAFAALLISMDMLTVQALPLASREYFSRQAANFGLWTNGPTVEHLKAALQSALWPEMLFDEGSQDSGHPICLARELGILNLERIYEHCTYDHSPPTTPTSSTTKDSQGSWTGSPVSVMRR